MIQFRWLKIVLLFVVFNIIHLHKFQNFCKLQNGITGLCVLNNTCPKYQKNSLYNNCSSFGINFVCCAAMEKIVTPNEGSPNDVPIHELNTLPNIIPQSTTNVVLPTTVTSNPPRQNMAEIKCEQYKHGFTKKAPIMTYIFGGLQSEAKEFPHMAALGFGSTKNIQWLCGASLISDQFVLTAAHCITSSTLGEVIVVRLGDIDLQTPIGDGNAQNFNISQKIIHPDYKPPLLYNDIALIKLHRPVKFSDYIMPICLDSRPYFQYTKFIATGWGFIDRYGPQSTILKKVDLKFYSNDVCNQNYLLVAKESLPYGVLSDTQICAGDSYGNKDTCKGDSGGPLLTQDDITYLSGITSFGRACGYADNPGVYTKVSYFVPWIVKNVW